MEPADVRAMVLGVMLVAGGLAGWFALLRHVGRKMWVENLENGARPWLWTLLLAGVQALAVSGMVLLAGVIW